MSNYLGFILLQHRYYRQTMELQRAMTYTLSFELNSAEKIEYSVHNL